jgi:hypothetical protein
MGWTCSILGNKNDSHRVWLVKRKDRWGSLGYQGVGVKLFKVNIKTKGCKIVDCTALYSARCNVVTRSYEQINNVSFNITC